MPIFQMKQQVKAHADLVWEVISDVGGLAEMAPHISKVKILGGEKVGLRRRVYDRRGKWWEEECIAWEDLKSYTMRVDTSHYPFAFSKMEFTWSVDQGPKNVLIGMRYEYKPKYGPIGHLLLKARFRQRFEKTSAELMENWIQRIHTREWAYRVRVETILNEKGNKVITVSPDTLVLDTVKLLRENRIGSVLALNVDGQIAGVVSERDIIRGLSESGTGVLQQPVSDIMTEKVVVCHPEDNMMLVMSCMTDRRVRHLPVMDHDKLVGIVSIGDVVKTRMAEMQSESDALRRYIEGREWRELYFRMGPRA